MKNKRINVLYLLITSFVLNLIWEILHTPLYIWNMPIKSTIYLKIILIATLGDILYLTLIFAIVLAFHKNLNWINNPSKKDYLLIIILGLLIAIFVEEKAIMLGKWAYTGSMPLILGIGLTPLIQLATTGVLTLLILKKIKS